MYSVIDELNFIDFFLRGNIGENTVGMKWKLLPRFTNIIGVSNCILVFSELMLNNGPTVELG